MSIQLDNYNNQLKVTDTVNTNAPIVLQPQGTGALQAQLADSTTTGGNARGANAVDWQTSRSTAAQIASGQASVIGGGAYNSATNGITVVVGGSSNSSTNYASSVLGGVLNTASGTYSAIGGGWTNSATGAFNFIGGGTNNSGTATAAVTTQAAATNGVTSGSTAVTLSGSNASIKVGQYITGTGIVFPTYVAAISGTSLTLSQNANATGTPTLSFYTPHGVVVGGGNNQATGSYSFIGGGGDAGTAANRNVASGDWSVVCGGAKNTASGIGSFIGTNANPTSNSNTASNQGSVIVGGTNQTSSGLDSFIGCGYSNVASGGVSVITGGSGNTANSYGSAILGGNYGTTRSITGNQVFSAHNSPIATTQGVSQSALLLLAVQTTDATATVLRSDTGAASTTNQVILPNNSAYYVRGSIVAGVTGGGNTSSWTFQGTIKRGATAASTALVAAITPSLVSQDVGAATWVVAVTADTTNGGLAVTVTGQAATTIRWVCKIETTEMTY